MLRFLVPNCFKSQVTVHFLKNNGLHQAYHEACRMSNKEGLEHFRKYTTLVLRNMTENRSVWRYGFDKLAVTKRQLEREGVEKVIAADSIDDIVQALAEYSENSSAVDPNGNTQACVDQIDAIGCSHDPEAQTVSPDFIKMRRELIAEVSNHKNHYKVDFSYLYQYLQDCTSSSREDCIEILQRFYFDNKEQWDTHQLNDVQAMMKKIISKMDENTPLTFQELAKHKKFLKAVKYRIWPYVPLNISFLSRAGIASMHKLSSLQRFLFVTFTYLHPANLCDTSEDNTLTVYRDQNGSINTDGLGDEITLNLTKLNFNRDKPVGVTVLDGKLFLTQGRSLIAGFTITDDGNPKLMEVNKPNLYCNFIESQPLVEMKLLNAIMKTFLKTKSFVPFMRNVFLILSNIDDASMTTVSSFIPRLMDVLLLNPNFDNYDATIAEPIGNLTSLFLDHKEELTPILAAYGDVKLQELHGKGELTGVQFEFYQRALTVMNPT